jgi:hypothetical protein
MAGKILITPSTGSTTVDPTITYQGTGSTAEITQRVTSTGNIQFEGQSGTLLTISSSGGIATTGLTGLTSAVTASRVAATTGGGAYAWSAGSAQVLELTLTGNVSPITATGTVAGTSYVLYIKQDSTGNRTATWSGFKWASGAAPTLSTAGNAVDIFTFYYDGSAMNCVGTSKGVA